MKLPHYYILFYIVVIFYEHYFGSNKVMLIKQSKLLLKILWKDAVVYFGITVQESMAVSRSQGKTLAFALDVRRSTERASALKLTICALF